MSLSPSSRHHYDQGLAAAKDNKPDEAGDHLQQIVRCGSTEDVTTILDELHDSLNNR